MFDLVLNVLFIKSQAWELAKKGACPLYGETSWEILGQLQRLWWDLEEIWRSEDEKDS